MLEEIMLIRIEAQNRQTMLDRPDTRQRLELLDQRASDQRRSLRHHLGAALIAIGAGLSSEALHERSTASRVPSPQGRLA